VHRSRAWLTGALIFGEEKAKGPTRGEGAFRGGGLDGAKLGLALRAWRNRQGQGSFQGGRWGKGSSSRGQEASLLDYPRANEEENTKRAGGQTWRKVKKGGMHINGSKVSGHVCEKRVCSGNQLMEGGRAFKKKRGSRGMTTESVRAGEGRGEI